MAQKKKTKAMVVSQEKLADGIYDLRLETELAQDAACGQFVGVYPKDKSTLLPRPISICEIDKEKNQLRLVYRVAGKGTAEFSNLKTGDSVYLLGVLGNGFPVDKAKPGTKAMLFGGGIGVPPILQLSKELSCEKQIVVGYRNAQCFLKEDFEQNGAVYVATEDGSVGTKGNVMDAVAANGLEADIIYACGRCRCCARFGSMRSNMIFRHIFPWKNGWHAVWAPVLAAFVKRPTRMRIPM